MAGSGSSASKGKDETQTLGEKMSWQRGYRKPPLLGEARVSFVTSLCEKSPTLRSGQRDLVPQ